MSNPLFRALATCARERGFIAAAEGHRARYWRELAASRRLLGFPDAADDFDLLAEEAR
jgi:hypothetical protein